jgi:hypothetical protein
MGILRKIPLRIFLVLLLCVVVAAGYFKFFPLHASKAQTQPNQSTTSNLTFGFSGAALLAMPQDKQLAALRDMKSMGITWVRFDVDWNGIQPNDSAHYTWSRYDRMMQSLQTVGLRGLAILDYTPAWARPANCADSDKCAPDPIAFARFASTVAERYAPQGLHDWEIWNEPNQIEFWKPKPDAAQYLYLLQLTSVVLHYTDPQATIITGGLSNGEVSKGNISMSDFVQALYKLGGQSSFNAIGLHPYTTPNLSSSNPGAWRQMQQVHDIMSSHDNSDKKIWITEYGAPTGGPGKEAASGELGQPSGTDHVSEKLQAQLMTDAIQNFSHEPWAGPFIWYNYIDSGTDMNSRLNFYGLRRYDGTPKPAYDAYKNIISSSGK